MSDVFETGRIKLSELDVAFCSYAPSERGEMVRGVRKGVVKLLPRSLVNFDKASPDGDLIQYDAWVEVGWFAGVVADECEILQLERFQGLLRDLRSRTKCELNFAGLKGSIQLRLARTSETSDVIRVTGVLKHPFGNRQNAEYDVMDDSSEPFPATLTFAFEMTDAELDDAVPGLDTLCREVRGLALQVPRTGA